MENIARLDKIFDKVNGLLKHYEQAKKDHVSLKDENGQMQKLLKERNERIEELENQMKVLKLAKQVSGTGDTGEKAELKRKINDFIKEIDKCVALLNN